MTTIAYRDGVLACDSKETHEDEKAGEISFYHTQKIYRKRVRPDIKKKSYEVLIATRGEVGASLIAVDWYGEGLEEPDDRLYSDSQFDLLIVEPDGLWTMDQYFRPHKIDDEEYYAIGSGTKAALGAMFMGATAVQAIEAAISCDPGTGGEVVFESL